MATAYEDSINGQPIRIAIDAVAWAQPIAAGWATRCRELNRLLGKQTHLLRVAPSDRPEPIWYAGVAGTSLAAGIELMAIANETLRESIVAFPLDERVYVASLQKGLVREEWILYPDAFDTRIQAWRAEGRNFNLLTGGGRFQTDLPNAAQIPVDMDTEAMTFRHASIALLAAGLLRWRDGVTLLGVLVLAIGLSLALAWWQRAPNIEPLQRVTALVTQPSAPVRFRASAELAALAMLAAEHDVALWDAHGATELKYHAAQGRVELLSSTEEPLNSHIELEPISLEPPQLRPYSIHEYRAKLTTHLTSPIWTLTFGEPYPIGLGSEFEQHATVSIGVGTDAQSFSIASALVDLSERLFKVPITLHQANCTIREGAFAACELSMAIRGLDR